MTLNRRISASIKIMLAIFALIYLTDRILHYDGWAEAFIHLKSSLSSSSILYLLATILLLPLNYGIETLKWKMAIRNAQRISWQDSLTGILTGLSMSILTPNRIGDIVTRNFVLKPENRITASTLTTVNSLSQTIATIIPGIPAAAYYLLTHHLELNTRFNQISLFLFSVLALTAATWIFFYPHLITYWLGKFRLFKWLSVSVDPLQKTTAKLKFNILLLALLKYLVYLTQFYLLLRFSGIALPLLQGLIALLTIYLMLNIIPVPPIGDIGVRATITLLVLAPLNGSLPAILFATTGVWLINIMIPAAIGLILLHKIRF